MTSMSDLRARYGPWALVTGASEGLGAAFAERLAEAGIHLALVARRRGPLLDIASRLSRKVETLPIPGDLGEKDDLRKILAVLADREIGLFVHSAAVSTIGAFLEREPEEHERLLDVSCRAPALLSHHLGKAMAARGRGGIVFLSSLAAHQGTALVAHYAASKAYQKVLAEGLWEELRPHGVDVLACLAGPTETPTYRSRRPAGGALEWPPVMSAAAVAEETLAALGRGPLVIPGVANKAAHLFMSSIPTSLAVKLVSASTRKMYRK